MAQVEAPANLDRWPTPEGRLITIILIRCGLRATDACTLAFDCLLHDGQQARPTCAISTTRCAARPPSRSMRNSNAEIRAQQQRVAARWPEHHPHLFPAADRQRRRSQPDDLLQLPRHAQHLAGRLRQSTTNTATPCT